MQNTFFIAGSVLDSLSWLGISEALVEAWWQERFPEAPIGTAVTNAQGEFTIPLDDNVFSDGYPELHFRVMQDGEEIHQTSEIFLWQPKTAHERVQIFIDRSVAKEPELVTDVRRITCFYAGSNLGDLVIEPMSQQIVTMRLPPPDLLLEEKLQSVQGYELRDDNGRVLYRRIIHNLIAFAYEVHNYLPREYADEKVEPPFWHEIGEIQGFFTLNFPFEVEGASTLSIFSSPLNLDEFHQSAVEVAVFDVNQDFEETPWESKMA